jgi:hypothetical protein
MEYQSEDIENMSILKGAAAKHFMVHVQQMELLLLQPKKVLRGQPR